MGVSLGAPKGNNGYVERRKLSAFERFRSFCRFEPETGCVVWTGGTSKGRGHHVPYPVFWFEGRRWFGHRWAAKYIHGHDIDGFHTDHCCPNIPLPNTLCVEHLQPLPLRQNVLLQHERRKRFIHMQVGLLQYCEVYGHDPEVPVLDASAIPFYTAPAWLGLNEGTISDTTRKFADCPF